MEGTYTSVFDSTMQKTHGWLREIAAELGTRQPEKAYLALRAVLHVLRDRLPVQESFDLVSQLPLMLKGVYVDGWDPARKPRKVRHSEEFFQSVQEQFQGAGDLDPASAVHAVFSVIGRHVTDGELLDIADNFPPEIREMWKGAALAAHQGG